MRILGISCYYHDASASLLIDGKIAAAAQEERFTRIKHDNSFPINAINYCLESKGLRIKDIDYIGFYEKPMLKFERLMHQHLHSFPKSLKMFLGSTPFLFNEKLRVIKKLRKLGYKGDVLFIPHHTAHAASAFLLSPFDEAAILTVDGVGEWTTTAYGYGKGNEITLRKEIRFPHSIGLLYSAMTAFLGFSVNNSEYKVMGLSAYGDMDKKTNRYYGLLKRIIDIKEDGSFRLDISYFKYLYSDRMFANKMINLLGKPRKAKERLTQRHKDIAAALQIVTEEVLTRILIYVKKETGAKNIVMAGGVALNSVFNGKLLKNTGFEDIWIQPNASDGGTSIGACAYIYNSILGNERIYIMKDAYLGPEYSDEYIKGFLESNNINHIRFQDDEELIEMTTKLLIEDHVVGWFHGRMEWGPRALGNRSILSNAQNPDMQDILNLKVKHREKFRPFAPVVCEDDAGKYFECDIPLPRPSEFMLMVYQIKEEFKELIPSVTHVDGSGRLQVIRKESNPLYYNLIKSFGEKSGIPILINTSFNIRGEPIVCTPQDAYRCMMGTGIDYLVIGSFLVRREDNPDDMWDSEGLASD